MEEHDAAPKVYVHYPFGRLTDTKPALENLAKYPGNWIQMYNKLKDTEARIQVAYADLAKLLGDQTHLYNKLKGVEAMTSATRALMRQVQLTAEGDVPK